MGSPPSPELTLDIRLALSPDCAFQMVGPQAIAIVPRLRRQHFFVNDVATDILRGIDEKKSIRQIRDGILQEYDAPGDRVEKDLLETCRKLVAEGIAVPVSD